MLGACHDARARGGSGAVTGRICIAGGSPGPQIWGHPAPWPTAPVQGHSGSAQGHVHGSVWGHVHGSVQGHTTRQPDPPVILGVIRARSGSARASVSFCLPAKPWEQDAALPGLGRRVGMLLGMWFLFILTLYGPTVWVCGTGGPASCPAVPERLGFILMCICTHSQRAQHWDHHAGCAVPSWRAWGWLLGSAKVWGIGNWVSSQLDNVCWWGGFFHKGKANLGQPAQIANWLKGEGRETGSAGQPGASSCRVKRHSSSFGS